MKFVALLTLLLSSGCTCKAKDARPPFGPGAYFEADLQHPWNRVFHALFDRERQISHPGCSQKLPLPEGERVGERADAKGCLALTLDDIRAAGSVAVSTQMGVDEPQAFIGEDVYFLRSEASTAAALKALSDALQPDPEQNPIGAVLLQSDLWERSDALELAIAEHDEGAAQFRLLLPAIARLMKRLALPREQLARIETNQGEMAESFPSLLPDFPKREEGWMELRRERPSADGGFEPFTAHSERWGYRTFFRIFARVPSPVGGTEWFHAPIPSPVRLPEDSVLLLAASPLVVTREGDLMGSPLITLAEVLRVRTDVLPETTLGELPFAVLEGTRAGLIAKPRLTGGLHQLAPETPVPMGATCVPDLSVRVPLTLSCLGCHRDRAQVGGAFAKADERIRLEPDPTAAAAAVIERKRAQPAFERLRQRAW